VTLSGTVPSYGNLIGKKRTKQRNALLRVTPYDLFERDFVLRTSRWENFEDMFSCFDRIPKRDRERETSCRAAQSSLCTASRGQNERTAENAGWSIEQPIV